MKYLKTIYEASNNEDQEKWQILTDEVQDVLVKIEDIGYFNIQISDIYLYANKKFTGEKDLTDCYLDTQELRKDDLADKHLNKDWWSTRGFLVLVSPGEEIENMIHSISEISVGYGPDDQNLPTIVGRDAETVVKDTLQEINEIIEYVQNIKNIYERLGGLVPILKKKLANFWVINFDKYSDEYKKSEDYETLRQLIYDEVPQNLIGMSIVIQLIPKNAKSVPVY